MRVEKEIQVSSVDFFNLIENSIKQDIKSATGKDIDVIKEGFKYKKELSNKLGSKGLVSVEIKEYNKQDSYKATFSTNRGENTIGYQVLPIDDNRTKIIYEEMFEGKSIFDKINNSIMIKFYDKKSRKRVASLIGSMEKYIVDNNKNYQQEKDDQ